jgi:orotidine-5'-phosphate decarboxylase
VCVALDVDDIITALSLVKALGHFSPIFKIGSHLFASGEGRRIIEEIHQTGAKVFLDLKFHDIPNTVANAAKTATRMGVHMFNVHSLGGLDMMRATADAVAEEATKSKFEKPLVLAITVLTSISQEDLRRDLLIDQPLDSYIAHLATLTRKSGLDGVVCSPREIRAIKQVCGNDFIVVTPGIRPGWSLDRQDQKRVLTAKQAFEMGADYIVVGRPIIKASSPPAALERLLGEISG